MTAVKSPLFVAWCQIRSTERPWVILLLLFALIPWFALTTAFGSDFYKLGSFFLLNLLMMALLSGDRRIYRTLGLNRAGAIRQQLIIFLPVLVLTGAVTLPGLSGTHWVWAPLVAAVALGTDIAITLNSVRVDHRGVGIGTDGVTFAGPAGSGGMASRLLVVPMLRWAIPFGVALGLVLAFSEGREGTLLWTMLIAFSLLGVVIAPVLALFRGTASLATWQSLGLPRRAWSWVVTPVAVLAPVLSILVALAVLALLVLWDVTAATTLHQVTEAGLGWAAMGAGWSLLLVSVTGFGGIFGSGLIGASGPLFATFGRDLLENPTSSNAAIAAVAGGTFFLIGLYLQYRLTHATNGARILPDTRKFADR